MKIIKARFKNFRLLRDVEIDFSTDPEKNLTVIRAENESGKTTLLMGLQWGLYGDAALPGRANEYRLHPVNWEALGEQIAITVEIDLEFDRSRRTRQGQIIPSTEVFRVTRTAYESSDGNEWKREAPAVSLHRQTDKGWVSVDLPERILTEELPEKLREVFFTDGDRALNFIEAPDTSSKRDRVERAIKSLLGLDIIDTSLVHIQNTSRRINREAKALGADSSVDRVATELEKVQTEIETHEGVISKSASALLNIEVKLDEIRKDIKNALLKGNKVDLERRLERAENDRKRAIKENDLAQESHSNLFRGMAFSHALIGKPINDAMAALNKLSAQKQIPKTSIPVLEEVLKAQKCICGDSLEDVHSSGELKRQHIQQLIEDSRKADELQGVLTDVYYATKALFEISPNSGISWDEEYGEVADRRDNWHTRLDELEKEQRELEVQIRQLGNVDIDVLQDNERSILAMLRRNRDEKIRSETARAHLLDRAEALKRERDRLLREQAKGQRVLANLNVAQDVKTVLEGAYDRITHEELTKVSILMNSYFLEMIGSDPEQSSIIRRAEISEEFDILVYGAGDNRLRTDQDINGGSRRALTLAFIMALTKVSEATAPNIIDTPLGMMSGYVKRSVLKTAARESSQLVLLLTRSEIAGCEDIIDSEAGNIFTLTNTGHYPKMLEHEPDSEIAQVVRCECDHRSACNVCQRRNLVNAV